MALGVLGPLEVTVGGRRVRLPAPRLRALLALLIAHAGQVVSVAALVDGLWWGAEAPPDAERTMRAYVSRLRAALRAGAGGLAGAVVVTRAPGYVLVVEPQAVDAGRFESLAADARQALRGGAAREAADRLAVALRLWRGEAYGEFDAPGLRAEAVRLERVRLVAVQDRVDADLAVGLGGELVAELEALTGRYPGHERLWGQLMVALYRAGRQAEALAAFRRARRVLVEDAGVEPTAALLDVHRRVLAQDPALLPEPARPAAPAAPAAPVAAAPVASPPASPAAVPVPADHVVPHELPAGARFFIGREEQLARLTEPVDGARTSAICAVDGMAGVGKTALVVLAAHRLAAAGGFPDGTLFVDLCGFGNSGPTDPMDALEVMLRGLGVVGEQIPPGREARVGLYRSVTARRRVLIVLDDARDEAQVRPLLPGTPTCRVLVTSRRRLAGLDDADLLTLDSLRPQEAARLFRAVAGAGRDLGDPTVVEQIVQACGLLPLAVRVAAARLRASPAWTGPALLTRLRHAQNRLAELDDGDRSVAAALAVSVRQLAADQRRAFAVLGLHPGIDYEPDALAALLGTTAEVAGPLLAGLERVNLVEGSSPGRYRFHDLVRTYTATMPVDREPALDRLYDHYAATTTAAVRRAYPYADLPARGDRPAAPGDRAAVEPGGPVPPHTVAAALAWLDTELPNLLAAARHAADRRRPDHTVAQAAALHAHLRTRGHYPDAGLLHRLALARTDTTTADRARVIALNGLGDIERMHDRHGEAADYHTRALDEARVLGDRVGEVRALIGLGWVHCLRGRHQQATDCYTAATRAARAAADPAGEQNARHGLGWVHYAQGRLDEAGACWAEAWEQAQALGDRQFAVTVLTDLGWVQYAHGRVDEAGGSWTSAWEQARADGYRVGELRACLGLGAMHQAQGRYGPAADCHAAALQIARAIGHRDAELNALAGVAEVSRAQGEYGAATGYFEQVLALATELGNNNWQFEGWFGLGRSRLATGAPRRARSAFRRAFALLRELNHPADEVRVHDQLGHVYQALGRPGRACRHWRRALRVLTGLDVPALGGVTTEALRGQLSASEYTDPATAGAVIAGTAAGH
ncbi:MAG TPA: BTAD domain-containing putative transcriptional regulator [Mycobacteriales bacterium]|nr:BTAD domain-containing putative transcriptional regulator [Mycobacteriales bacterium]